MSKTIKILLSLTEYILVVILACILDSTAVAIIGGFIIGLVWVKRFTPDLPTKETK